MYEQRVVVEVVQQLAAAAETNSLLAKKDAEEFLVECWAEYRRQRLHLGRLEAIVFSFNLWAIAAHFSCTRFNGLPFVNGVDHQIDDVFADLGRQSHEREAVDGRRAVYHESYSLFFASSNGVSDDSDLAYQQSQGFQYTSL